MTWDSASYMTAKHKKAEAAKRAKQRKHEREQAHLKKLDGLIDQWMKQTTTVITDTPEETKA